MRPESERRVSDRAASDVVTATPGETVRDVAMRLSERRAGTVVVVDAAHRPLGIVTDRDLVERCLVAGRDPRRLRVQEVMSSPALWVHQDGTVEHALEEMARHGVRHLPVIDARERLCGLLALDDLLRDHFPPDSAVRRLLALRT